MDYKVFFLKTKNVTLSFSIKESLYLKNIIYNHKNQKKKKEEGTKVGPLLGWLGQVQGPHPLFEAYSSLSRMKNFSLRYKSKNYKRKKNRFFFLKIKYGQLSG